MTVYQPCYCTREQVQRALDMTPSQSDYSRIDRAVQAAREQVDGLCHRRFFSVSETKLFDWPNFQYSYPWRIWLDQAELADVTSNVPVVTTGGMVIPSGEIFWRTGGSWNYGPPYTGIELNRATTAAFGVSQTPQQDVEITGIFGYSDDFDLTATLGAAISSVSATQITLSNGNPGVGDTIIVDVERMLVMDRTWADTTYAQQSGCTTASAADNTLGVTSGSAFTYGDVLLLDSEQMLILSINGNSLTVKRAYNGTVLATHSSAEIYAQWSYTVSRGGFGSAAATHLNDANVYLFRVPALVKELAVAEASNMLLQESSGSARQVGEPGASQPAPGGSLPELRDLVLRRYGRKGRRRVV